MPACSAAAGNTNGVGRCGLVERCQRHGLRSRNCGKAKPGTEQRYCNDLHDPFLSCLLRGSCPVCDTNTSWNRARITTKDYDNEPGDTLPVATVPPAMMPVTVPAPAIPAAAVPTPMPATVPADLFGLEMLDLVPADDGGLGLNGRQPSVFHERMRRQRCRLRARSKRCGACNESEANFQKVTTFHDFSSPGEIVKCKWREFGRVQMNGR
jgi:hypothetical protein